MGDDNHLVGELILNTSEPLSKASLSLQCFSMTCSIGPRYQNIFKEMMNPKLEYNWAY